MKKKVSLYIHIPFCLSKCDYCDFFSVTGCSQQIDGYIQNLSLELKYRLEQYGKCQIKTVYVGGGTPSLLNANQIAALGQLISPLEKSDDFEFTFEVNPDDVTAGLLKALEQAGVNRISCGVQSFSEQVLKSIHRRAKTQQINAAFELFEANWHKKLSVDLICGLPFETEKTMLDALKSLCKSNVSHISFYSLCVEPETPLGDAIIKNKIMYDADFSDELWLRGRDFLLQNGYEQYEISNFCLKGYECLHSMTYWTHGDYIGTGAGGTGTVYAADGTGTRWTNTKNITEYIDFWGKSDVCADEIPQNIEKIDLKTSQFEYFMMGLRTKRGISTSEYSAIFGRDINPQVIKTLEKWCKDGLCECENQQNAGKTYHLNNQGMLFLNALLEQIV